MRSTVPPEFNEDSARVLTKLRRALNDKAVSEVTLPVGELRTLMLLIDRLRRDDANAGLFTGRPSS